MIDDKCKECTGRGYTEEIVNMYGEIDMLVCPNCGGSGKESSRQELEDWYDQNYGRYSR